MKTIRAFASAAGFLVLVGLFELASRFVEWAGIPFPGALLAMLALYAGLSLGVVPLKLVECACRRLMEFMPLYFVPILVGITAYRGLLAGKLLPIISAVLISSAATIACTGCCVEFLHRRRLARIAARRDSGGVSGAGEASGAPGAEVGK